jgi:threonine synthase
MNQQNVIEETDFSLWRYGAVLPEIKEKNTMTLGEGFTSLVSIENEWNVSLYIKDETKNPTGSFKDRGMALAISMAKEQGVKAICLPSAGNAGIAAAAYCEKAGIECHVFLPESIPSSFVKETEKYHASVYLKGGTIAEAGKEMLINKQKHWFDISTLKEPFRVEGKKTMGYEIVEQLGWKYPGVVIYPTGGGTGLIGMWKAFNEMKWLGWVEGNLPRMASIQSSACAPVVTAFENEKMDTKFWDSDSTQALGLNVPGPIGGAWMLNILNESGGTAVSVDEADIEDATSEINARTGINASLEAGVVWLGLKKLLQSGWIQERSTVVVPITGVER